MVEPKPGTASVVDDIVIPKLGATAAGPGFGSTIDFTLVYGVGGGPSWTLTSFTGIGASGGLLNYTRTNKDTLTLGFVKATTNATPGKPLTAEDKTAID